MYVVLRVSEPSVPGFGLLGINRQQLVLVDYSSQVGRAPGEGGRYFLPLHPRAFGELSLAICPSADTVLRHRTAGCAAAPSAESAG